MQDSILVKALFQKKKKKKKIKYKHKMSRLSVYPSESWYPFGPRARDLVDPTLHWFVLRQGQCPIFMHLLDERSKVGTLQQMINLCTSQ